MNNKNSTITCCIGKLIEQLVIWIKNTPPFVFNLGLGVLYLSLNLCFDTESSEAQLPH